MLICDMSTQVSTVDHPRSLCQALVAFQTLYWTHLARKSFFVYHDERPGQKSDGAGKSPREALKAVQGTPLLQVPQQTDLSGRRKKAIT